MKKIRFKCWIEDENEKFYGPGPNELLKIIQKEGSLSRAAEQMNMSYKKAWDIIRRLNAHTETPMVILKKGGSHGGGAEVTEKGLKAIEHFEMLQRQMKDLVEEQDGLLESLK